ncbi:Elongation factor 1-beta' [Papilio xuthus]|uniref:Elongation factor 1-beta n=1 Tax=Papilio xuthus TaxID=66420 RepID=I4DIX0_PAPXU|nr:elongation factor 1-beta' [Papilio xuthus]KPI99866.1 Elongation factor 1-beta' [Papilio xuthus]BAM17860.1 elongation factor 1 beta [Papilio xuthus]
MAFGDVKTNQGLNELNTFLADKSYISGYTPTQADVQVFNEVGKAPAASLPHVLRWYNHIASYSATERQTFAAGVSPLKAGATTTTAPAAASKEEDDDDVDLFGSGDEEEDAEAARIREERLKAYADKKSKKPALIAKSSIILDVKPWDDETDMKEMENQVRTIEMDGLLWGASKLVPVGYGINKLQIMCVIEDDKVSVDLLTEKIQEFEDFVQSVDIAAFNKI